MRKKISVRRGQTRVSTRLLIILTAGFVALCALAAWRLRTAPAVGTVARILVNGEILREIDLSAVKSEETFIIEGDEGFNTVAVRPGAIRICDADCPDRICVNRGWMSGGLTPIVCLPHGLVIELTAGGDPEAPDAVSG